MTLTPAPSADSSDHDTRGRFRPGNKASHGRSGGKIAQRYRNALIETATDKDRRDIARALIEAAKGGDILAIREFYNRTEGQAPQRVELSASGGAGDAPKVAFDFAAFAAFYRRQIPSGVPSGVPHLLSNSENSNEIEGSSVPVGAIDHE